MAAAPHGARQQFACALVPAWLLLSFSSRAYACSLLAFLLSIFVAPPTAARGAQAALACRWHAATLDGVGDAARRCRLARLWRKDGGTRR